jgi:hypothetical protein
MSHTNAVTPSFAGVAGDSSRRRRPFLSVAALLRGNGLDRQLGSGVEPWRTPLLAARARQLTSDRKRRLLARGLEQLVEQAEEPARVGLTAAITPSRPSVREARPLLLMLAARLRAGDPVDPRAVAAVNKLLTTAPVRSTGGVTRTRSPMSCVGSSRGSTRRSGHTHRARRFQLLNPVEIASRT